MTTLVIGIGNTDRGDDAAGIRVVEAIERRALPGVRSAKLRGDLLALLDAWEGADHVVLVDAMRSGAEPGAVLRLDVSAEPAGAELGGFVSSHALGLADAIELARGLGRLPPRLVVFGIEARAFGRGEELSSAVASAVATTADRIEEECRCTKPR